MLFSDDDFNIAFLVNDAQLILFYLQEADKYELMSKG